MTDITPSRTNIQLEGAEFRAAVSEFLIQSLGAGINFINERQHSEKQFFLNGRYNALITPYAAVDGLTFFQFDAEIIDVWAFTIINGAGGTTSFDIKIASTPGGSFTSIFSTNPSIDASAGSYIWIHVGSTVPNTVAPVFASPNVNGNVDVSAGQAIRFDLLSAQTGVTGAGPRGCGIVVHYRPR